MNPQHRQSPEPSTTKWIPGWAADAVAVIAAADRAQFCNVFQQFAERRGLALTFSRKALSKSRRV